MQLQPPWDTSLKSEVGGWAAAAGLPPLLLPPLLLCVPLQRVLLQPVSHPAPTLPACLPACRMARTG
jgi:hypothetical protein